MAEAIVDEKIETDADGETPVDIAEPKSSKKKLIIFAGGGIGLLLLISAGLYFTGMLDRFLGHKEAAAEAARLLRSSRFSRQSEQRRQPQAELPQAVREPPA